MARFIRPSRFFSTIVHTAVVSLWQHKLRSSLSILGIVCGVMAVLAIMAVGEGARRETVRRIEQMGIRNIFIRADNLTPAQMARARRYHSQGLQPGDLQRLEALGPHLVRSSAIRRRIVDLVGFPEHVTPAVIESDAEYSRILGLSMSAGRFIAARDVSQRNRVCVLGWSVAAALGPKGKPGNMLRIGSDVWRIVGIMRQKDATASGTTRISLRDINEMIIVPIGAMGRSADFGDGRLSEIIVEIDGAERVQEAATLVRRKLEVAHRGVADFNMIIPLELLAQRQRIQRLFTIVFGSIGGLSLIIGGIGIMNIMLASVSERVREIGLRRAVGARPVHIIVQFLSEAVILTAIGGFLGSAGGVFLSLLISLVAGWPIEFTPGIVIAPLALAVFTGCFFGLYPALKASRMEPLRALGYVV